MFGWRRRSEGFEWREYVRTTVLVRRADRQRKVDDVRMAAVAKVKDTKDRGVAASRATAEVAGNHLAELARAIGRALWDATLAIAAMGARAVRAATSAIAERLPNLSRPSWLSSSRATSGAKRLGRLLLDAGFRLPFNSRWLTGGAFALVLIFAGGPMLNSSQGLTVARFIPALSAVSIHQDLTGRALAVNGDMLRIDATLVRLSGIEAPEAKQPCLKGNGRRWNCGASARAALERNIRGKTVSCTPAGQDGDGNVLAACRVNNSDLAESLVRGGHVFATSGFLASYGAAESAARNDGAGLWQGENIRPKEWRDQIWQEAKRAAPEGCPIKGYVHATDRTYAMPWSNGYDGAKMRTVRGDRWFCTEEEARAAGFNSSSRS